MIDYVREFVISRLATGYLVSIVSISRSTLFASCEWLIDCRSHDLPNERTFAPTTRVSARALAHCWFVAAVPTRVREIDRARIEQMRGRARCDAATYDR